MKENVLEKAMTLIEKELRNDEYFFSGAKNEISVETAEKRLSLRLPPSYREFIKKLGCGNIGPYELYGLTKDIDYAVADLPSSKAPNVVWVNLYVRETLNQPYHLLIIYSVGEGTTYCLDTSQMNEEGECPVVAWPIGGHETTPKLEVVAEDFGKFFLDMVERQIEYKKQGS